MIVHWILLLVLIVAGSAAARRAGLPEAVVWCVGGIAAGFVPGLSELTFDPQVALLVLVPPLVYSAAVVLPWPEFRGSIRPISALALGLVAVSIAITALIAHHLVPLPWNTAIALGAVVAPTDPVAATAIANRVGLPHRVSAILEGEGLVNDAIALTVLRLAIATSTFSLGAGLLNFAVIVIGEPLYGWLVAVLIARVRARVSDARMEIAISLLTPFVAYLVPEHLGGSGILATVAAGMYIGEQRSAIVPAGTRLHSVSFWTILTYLLNGTLFLLAGMQLKRLLVDPEGGALFLTGVVVAAVIAVTRYAWSAAVWALSKVIRRLLSSEGHPMPARHMVLIASSGMRGPVSLAAALSIPAIATTGGVDATHPVLVIVAAVIVLTLVVQGTGLLAIARATGVSKDAEAEAKEVAMQESFGRMEAARAALGHIDLMRRRGDLDEHLAARFRRVYEERTREDDVRHAAGPMDGGKSVPEALISAERARVAQLRREGRIGDYAATRVERDLDLREIVASRRTE